MNSEFRIPNSEFKRLAFVALGSNLGDSQPLVLRAMARLQDFSEQPLLCSSLWQTTPVACPPGSPAFVNAMAGLRPRPDETPESLLDRLQAVESEFGRRTKVVLNEPRPLDLDLITFGAMVVQSMRLTLPHPRAHLRRFVLAPLAELAPDLVLPQQTKTVRELLEELISDEVVQRLG